MITTIEELQTVVFQLYRSQNYAEACAVIDGEDERFPEHKAAMLLWKTRMLAAAGRTDEALQTLAKSIEGGHWYYDFYLRDINDFQALQGNPEFERLIMLSQQRLRDIIEATPPKRLDVPLSTTKLIMRDKPR